MSRTSPPPTIPKPRLLDYGLIGLLIIVWGSAYAMTAVALQGFAPMVLVEFRLVVGALVLGLVCAALRARLPALGNWRAWGALALVGVAGTLAPFGLISHAQERVPSALAAVYIAAAPIVVAILAHFAVPGEKLDPRRALGVVLGFGGIVVLFAPALLGGASSGAGLGDQLMLLMAACCYATASILVRLVQPNLHPIAMSFGFVLISAVLGIPFAVAEWPPGGISPNAVQLACAIGLALGSTALGNVLYVVVVRRVGPVFLANAGNLMPFWSLLLGAGLLGEAVPPTLVAGLTVILAGIWLVRKKTA
jgi:drug/metabolite transporter (DMT)-like permease